MQWRSWNSCRFALIAVKEARKQPFDLEKLFHHRDNLASTLISRLLSLVDCEINLRICCRSLNTLKNRSDGKCRKLRFGFVSHSDIKQARFYRIVSVVEQPTIKSETWVISALLVYACSIHGSIMRARQYNQSASAIPPLGPASAFGRRWKETRETNWRLAKPWVVTSQSTVLQFSCECELSELMASGKFLFRILQRNNNHPGMAWVSLFSLSLTKDGGEAKPELFCS